MGSKTDQLTKQEYEKLIQAAHSIKTKLIIALAGEAGMRAGEIAHMTRDWVDFQDKKIRIPRKQDHWMPKTKNSARTIPYRHNPRLEELLAKYFTIENTVNLTRQSVNS